MKKIYSVRNKLIEDVNKTIEKKILTLSEDEIDQILSSIDKSYDELYILEQLQVKFEDKSAYYYARLYIKYDWDAFRNSIIALIISTILMSCLYIAFFHYNLFQQLVTIFKISKDHRVIFHHDEQTYTFAECSQKYITFLHDYLQIIANENISSKQLLIMSKLTEPFIYISVAIYVIVKKTIGLFFTIIVMTICGYVFKYTAVFLLASIMMCTTIVFVLISDWLWPQYNQHYEKWHMIEYKTTERMLFLKNKNQTKLFYKHIYLKKPFSQQGY